MAARLIPQAPPLPTWLRVAVNEEDVEQLAELILDPGREQPVVCLTSQQGERNPAFDPWEVREIVGEDQPIWFVPNGPLTYALARRLPPKLELYGGGARIWWVGVTAQSDPHDHRLVRDPHGVYGSKALAELRDAFARGAPSAPAPVADQRVALLTRERDGLQRRIDGMAGDLRQAEQERDSGQERAGKAERRLRDERQKPMAQGPAPEARPGPDDSDEEAAFHRLILERWLEKFLPGDRAAHPLGRYVLAPAFLESLRKLELAPPERVAEVCALVACGRARESGGLEPHPLRSGAGGSDPQRLRARDGAKAMRCAVKRNTPAAPRLHYWERGDGVVEFAVVARHENFEIPEGTS